MFDKVLVPLDGTRESQAIVPYVTQLASGLDLPLVLLSVILVGEGPEGAQSRSGLFETHEKEAKHRLATVVQNLKQQRLTAEAVTVGGRPEDEIVRVAGEYGCGLIAMTTHSKRAVAVGVLGSVTDRVVHTAPMPVLTMSLDTAEMYAGQKAVSKALARSFDPRMTRIMVPLDGTPLSEAVLPYVAGLARGLALKVTLVRVVRQVPVAVGEKNEAAEQEQRWLVETAHVYLEDVAGRLRESGTDVAVHVSTGPVATRIIGLGANWTHDIIAIATHPAPKWRLGSVAEALVRGTGDPILTLTPGTA